MKLSRDQRKRLVTGDYTPLFFTVEPECEKGTTYVLTWARESRSHVGDGQVAVTPAAPTRWITVSEKRRQGKGWLIAFTVHDQRSSNRYVRRSPPVWNPETMKRDQHHAPTKDEIRKARIESNYTGTLRDAVDNVFGVEDHDLDRFTQNARMTEHSAKAELAGSMRQVESALTDRLKSLPSGSMVDGEIRRARKQVRQALEKLDKQLRSLEREAA